MGTCSAPNRTVNSPDKKPIDQIFQPSEAEDVENFGVKIFPREAGLGQKLVGGFNPVEKY